MNLKESLGRERRNQQEDLNITPVMNIFLILVPFLLLTAVFVRIAVIEFSLPSANKKSEIAGAKPGKAIVTILAINEKGFELKTHGVRFPIILKKQDNFDFQTLVARLKQVKQLHNDTEDIIIAPQASIKYDTIIKVMDRCRENGFPNISISG
ncbi:MAG: ExbD/TolR family protein [bacterium]